MNVKRWRSRNNHARLLRASLRFGGEAALPGHRLNPWLPRGGRSKARGGRRRKSHARRGGGRGAQHRPRLRATPCDPVRPRAGLPRLPLPSATGTVGARAFRTEQNFRADVYTCASRGAAPEGEQEGGQGRRSSGVRDGRRSGAAGEDAGRPSAVLVGGGKQAAAGAQAAEGPWGVRGRGGQAASSAGTCGLAVATPSNLPLASGASGGTLGCGARLPPAPPPLGTPEAGVSLRMLPAPRTG